MLLEIRLTLPAKVEQRVSPVQGRQPGRTAPGLSLCIFFVAVLFITVFSRAQASVQWEEGVGFRSAPLTIPLTGKTGFTLLPYSSTGIDFTNLLSEQRHLTNQILLTKPSGFL